MLRKINLLEYTFQDGHLVFENVVSKEQKKIDLALLIRPSMEIAADKLQAFMLTNNSHNLTKVLRTRTDSGVFSDYPHFYAMVQEGKEIGADYAGELFGVRHTENGEFIISSKKDDYTINGQNFVGILKPNFLGTQFDLWDSGFEETICKMLPDNFLPVR